MKTSIDCEAFKIRELSVIEDCKLIILDRLQADGQPFEMWLGAGAGLGVNFRTKTDNSTQDVVIPQL